MIIEKATSYWDLPHAEDITDQATQRCRCGRNGENELHRSADLTEKAGAQPAPLITEKGV